MTTPGFSAMNLLRVARPDWVPSRDVKPSKKVAPPQTHGPRLCVWSIVSLLSNIPSTKFILAICLILSDRGDATEHAKVALVRCPSLPTALPHWCFSPERQPCAMADNRIPTCVGCARKHQLIRDQRTQQSGALIRFGLAASASCGKPPTRYGVFSASVVCLAIAKSLFGWLLILLRAVGVAQLPLACCFQTSPAAC
ncbi:unnamed protein product [Fusarium graminearum]|uniref:Uncharacterized protein n=1 Tax=Gibberella zeae TaxID=5518 RepID=A0A9N8RL93_GIBZA|nr:unnamed protein product [Fusarium graminearum]CAG1999708.1 unnamed protein product [Fusarium graminearum]CAG2017203.1 unnamed protein product [Fusarium graminearum]